MWLFGRRRGPKASALLFPVLGLLLLARELWRRGRAIDLQGQVVLITGGGRGLGFALARAFAAEGARIAICGTNQDTLEAARRKLAGAGAVALTIRCDVTDREQVRRMVEQVTEHYGRVDVLVNNAGVITVGPLETQTLDDYEHAMNVMFWGLLHSTLAVLPQMRARRGGRIVNITSIGGKVSVPHLLPYSCAKFAAVGLSEGLGAELAKDGVAVVTVAPGLMRTGSAANASFKGKHTAEYAWFSLSDSMPFTSISAARAAARIVAATRRGDPEVLLSAQAQAMSLFHGVAPGLTIDLLGIVNRLLPSADGTGTAARRGRESETPSVRRLLEALGQADRDDLNE